MEAPRDPDDLQELDRLLSGLAGDLATGMKRRQRRRRIGRAAGMLLSLATVGAAIWLSRDSVSTGPLPPFEPALDVASSRPFALIPTSRSDITVIWLLTPEVP